MASKSSKKTAQTKDNKALVPIPPQVDEPVPDFVTEINILDVYQILKYWDLKQPLKQDMQNSSSWFDIRTGYRVSNLQFGRYFTRDESGKKIEDEKIQSYGILGPFREGSSGNKGDFASRPNGYRKEKDPEWLAQYALWKSDATESDKRRKIRFDVTDMCDGRVRQALELIAIHAKAMIKKHYKEWAQLEAQDSKKPEDKKNSKNVRLFMNNRDPRLTKMMLESKEIEDPLDITEEEIDKAFTKYEKSWAAPLLTERTVAKKDGTSVTKWSFETKINVLPYKNVPACILRKAPLVPSDPNNPNSPKVRAFMEEEETVDFREMPFDQLGHYIALVNPNALTGKGSDVRFAFQTEYLEWFPTEFVGRRTARPSKEEDMDDAPVIKKSDLANLAPVIHGESDEETKEPEPESKKPEPETKKPEPETKKPEPVKRARAPEPKKAPLSKKSRKSPEPESEPGSEEDYDPNQPL